MGWVKAKEATFGAVSQKPHCSPVMVAGRLPWRKAHLPPGPHVAQAEGEEGSSGWPWAFPGSPAPAAQMLPALCSLVPTVCLFAFQRMGIELILVEK